MGATGWKEGPKKYHDFDKINHQIYKFTLMSYSAGVS